MNLQQDLQLIGDILRGDMMRIQAGPRDVAAAWERIKAAAVLSAPAFPSFMGFMIAIDPSLGEGVVEFRDNTGKVLGTFTAEKRA